MLELENASEIYINLLEPKQSYWEDKEIPIILNAIKIMGLRTCYPFLISIAENITKTTLKKDLFKEVESLGFRYSIILNNNPNKLEVKYAEWSKKLCEEKISIDSLKSEINKIKPNDDDFKRSFAKKRITENKISAYILRKIGRELHGGEILKIDENATVEHVLPQKPDKWREYIKENNEIKINGEEVSLDEFIEEITYRIGNQTLLLSDDNSKLGNEPFITKKENVFSKSNFFLNKEIN